ncbi:RNA-directed DNA polymerase [Alisedimentitalea sp. MJ-SS2]|uniref:RNA-directed DNA polymerase n=1 Tax=Aliisedimentitalea sp. MJ-SS2 TaxID=3049795 RepID=UPI0029087BF1|nr:RNA-directed DNA polymerase [Alisedimentitalea sp. MJ-SS2]MDU8928225.1 RNA-directed DNA polymerase [Alisedimentitalea sp. MJ-SS2]
MTSKKVIFQRLLERGFYPRELPPTFRTDKFGALLASKPEYLKPQDDFSGETIFLDGATFQGNHRTFGIINPINYAMLSEFLAGNWKKIEKVMAVSQFSAFKISFPDNLIVGGRAFQKSSFSGKLKKQAYLSSAYPSVVHLDINRFYGSIYSHSIPWAVLGKSKALKRHKKKTLEKHWSAQLDRLVRACNRNQTIGIPIGPDTSRVVSEILLSRIDCELKKNGPGLQKRQVFHNIDDYEIGVENTTEAERVIARFEKEIRKFELRSHDGKTQIASGELPENLRWEPKFSLLKDLEDAEFLNGFFALLASEREAYPGSNVVGYGLSRFAKKIASCADKELALRHLQTLLYSSPRFVSWVAPLIVGLKGGDDLDRAQKRMLRWGVEECSRRHDTVSLLWFLYLYIHFDLKLSKAHKNLCFEVESVLVDLVLAHADHNGLVKGGLSEVSVRYSNSTLSSSEWLFLYETEKRGWKAAAKNKKIGQPGDPRKFFKLMNKNDVHFYDVSAFGISAFAWALKEDDFYPAHEDEEVFPDFDEVDADEYDSDDFFFY